MCAYVLLDPSRDGQSLPARQGVQALAGQLRKPSVEASSLHGPNVRTCGVHVKANRMTRHGWDGHERRAVTPENETRRAEHGRRAGSNVRALIAVLAVLAGGYVAIVNRMLPGQQPALQVERSDSGMWCKLGEIDQRLAQHVTQSDALVNEWRRDQAAATPRRDRAEERMRSIERKLDLVLYKLGINQQISEGQPAGPGQRGSH